MQVTAQLNNLRVAPRKVRLASRLLKGMNVVAARHQLDYLVKKSAKPLAKLLDSAVANARNNFGLVRENLFIKDIIVNEGAKLKRFKAKGFGMTSPIQKKTSHIKLTLEEKVPGLKAEKAEKTIPTVEPKAIKTETKIAKVAAKPEVKKEIGKRGIFSGVRGLGRKLFRRKAV